MSRLACVAVLVVVPLVVATPSLADPPAFNVNVSGLELLPQSIAGAAIFLFNVDGVVDGRQRRGFGWIAINHEELPIVPGESSLIVRGEGVIYVGLRRYTVEVNGGLLTLLQTFPTTPQFDDVFEVFLSADISLRGESGTHDFAGVLDHRQFPPTIVGPLSPATP